MAFRNNLDDDTVKPLKMFHNPDYQKNYEDAIKAQRENTGTALSTPATMSSPSVSYAVGNPFPSQHYDALKFAAQLGNQNGQLQSQNVALQAALRERDSVKDQLKKFQDDQKARDLLIVEAFNKKLNAWRNAASSAEDDVKIFQDSHTQAQAENRKLQAENAKLQAENAQLKKDLVVPVCRFGIYCHNDKCSLKHHSSRDLKKNLEKLQARNASKNSKKTQQTQKTQKTQQSPASPSPFSFGPSLSSNASTFTPASPSADNIQDDVLDQILNTPDPTA